MFSKLILNIQKNYGNYKLEYPKELWELHDDYSLAPVKEEIKKEMLSEYQLKIAELYNIPIGNVKKLVTNFLDKEKHVLHYKNLQFYLGLVLKVLEFDQSECLKPYTEFNAKKNRSSKK